jgi:hypothetical protein
MTLKKKPPTTLMAGGTHGTKHGTKQNYAGTSRCTHAVAY